MVVEGTLFAAGAGRTAHYVARRTSIRIERKRAGLAEDRLYQDVVRELPELAALPDNADRVFHYAFTEMVNNAIDHSRGRAICCEVTADGEQVRAVITDDGIGAFENVRRALRLERSVDAVGEISKGKTTTDADHHTGQGIFFTSKAVDRFELASGEVRWLVDNRIGDQTIGTASLHGTRVAFEIAYDTTRELRKLFDEYTTEFAFDRSRTMVRLFAYGTSFVSRSEAKRLLHGLERFREVILDFAGVEMVGQGFVDEVFRVWPSAHHDTRLLPANMIEPVRFMVERGLGE